MTEGKSLVVTMTHKATIANMNWAKRKERPPIVPGMPWISFILTPIAGGTFAPSVCSGGASTGTGCTDAWLTLIIYAYYPPVTLYLFSYVLSTWKSSQQKYWIQLAFLPQQFGDPMIIMGNLEQQIVDRFKVYWSWAEDGNVVVVAALIRRKPVARVMELLLRWRSESQTVRTSWPVSWSVKNTQHSPFGSHSMTANLQTISYLWMTPLNQHAFFENTLSFLFLYIHQNASTFSFKEKNKNRIMPGLPLFFSK